MPRKIKIATMVFIVLVIASGGYFSYVKYFSKKYQKSPNSKNYNFNSGNPVPQPKPSLPSAKIPKQNQLKTDAVFSGYKLYKSSEFGFEIQYPGSWVASEEDIVNVRGENTKAFYFKKPDSDLRFAILPRDGLSYGLPGNGTTTDVIIGGSVGSQTQFTLADSRRLWLLHPNYSLFNWSQDIGRIDAMTSVNDPVGDTVIFEKMLNSFKLKM